MRIFPKKMFMAVILVAILLTGCSMNSQIPITEVVPTTVSEALPPEVIAEIQNQISETLGVSIDQIQIETVERREWPDSCLGLGGPDEACAEVITHGWLVVLSIDGKEYRFRIDENGTTIRQET